MLKEQLGKLKTGDILKRLPGGATGKNDPVVGQKCLFKRQTLEGWSSLEIFGFKKSYNCHYFDFVRSFDINKDLLPGDKIKRISEGMEGLDLGKVYTFESYVAGCIPPVQTLKIEEKNSTWDAHRFEFVERPNTQLQKEKENKMATKSIKTTTFEKAKAGDAVYSIRKGYGTIESDPKTGEPYPIKVHFKNNGRDCYTLDGKEFSHDFAQLLFWGKPQFEIPFKEIEEKPDLKRKEFIEAMKETAKEYISGTHDFDSRKCKLCAIVREATGKAITQTLTGCEICPWVQLTGKTCIHTLPADFSNRVITLMEWIKEYEKLLKEEA